MPKYAYKAKSRTGQIKSGEVNASSKHAAKTMLSNRGLRILKLTATAADLGEGSKTSGFGRFIYRDKNGSIQLRLGAQLPTTRELGLFTKQFSLMIENGIPMLQALQMLRDQQRKIDFAETIEKIIRAIEQGSSLTDALEPFPDVFDSLYIAMSRAGEASGRLDVILKQLVSYIEKAAKLKAQVKSAMAYPLIIVVVAIAVVTLLLVFVVPSFAKQFTESGQEIPALTQLVMDMSNALVNNWMEILGTIVAAFFGLRYYLKTDNGKKAFDRAILRAPIIGEVMIKISVGRFCSTMSTMLSSGVSILEALTICATSSGNKSVESFVLNVREEISKGSTFADPLSQDGFFPKMVVSMVAVGESTGTLDETLRKVTDIYEEEVDNAIAAMMSMIEPLMIVVIGGIVGFIVIAMYLPIFGMAGTV
ncbi:MAG TPA: type II secretion system F family protein [Oligoflexus sp.]|uniref:type II secretion system F family protein n=1 Tax=Oligoflexus sp. TaxID=1971216 RepID=UPI002D3D3E49|nr:type II secretion system F family protein [Oligoflexus sp.]HYX34780.1 type II secretion system F family protein [Oligoflexus sp.]